MCGIAGILGAAYSVDRMEQLSHRMQTALQHRGPDDRGLYHSPDGQTALVHTRLSILDLSAAGHQPMSTPDGRYWISFNGEIYNFRQLRSQLEAIGKQFYSQTDTEVILQLYQHMGAACVEPLRGMFAFAIWDDLEKTCFLARDPLGIKPLYYWQSGSMLVFASELRTVLASGLPSRQLSMVGLHGYLTTGSVPEPHTLIEGIHSLEAGHWMEWQQGAIKQSQYWHLQFGADAIAPSEAISNVRSALLDSVRHHLVSDVPVGVFLSGGIDSTAIVALARQLGGGELRTFAIAFEDAAWNEGAMAQKVAQQFATEHTECVMTAALGRSLLPKFLHAIDQPSIDGFNTFCVSQLAGMNGTNVVLSGLGGDELFGGYRSFQVIPQMLRFAQRLQGLAGLPTLVGQGLEQWGQSARMRRLGHFLQQKPDPESAYRSFRGIFTPTEATAIVRHYLPGETLPPQLTHHIAAQPSLADTISLLEMSHYMRNQLLRDSDVMAMSWGLELRVPFVDRALLDAIATIPSELRLAPGKQLLTQAVPEIPEWVVNRPKQGFVFPFETWLQGEWQDYVQGVPQLPGISLQPWYRRWSLVVLQHWWRQIA
jgi:asparagine synthase (glutamine-hydrolysing)